MKVICVEQLQSERNKLTFRAGEEYSGNKVNEHWWVVDSVGISIEDFNTHFKVADEKKTIMTEEEASREVIEK